ncbi:hypothetical protein L596_017222 [Steinernema carpocapsae]|uniref:Snurportin-1 n=1 Tax=Steinernema carpocapsae TaxID=34508 RepID=A0A4U5N1S1_STECR|nr:hypothetical protein L596_017222 [Steinernema carpocapsae]
MDPDSLADMLAGDFSVKSCTADTEELHPRFAQFKNEGKIRESQERRRRDILERQKESRFNYVNRLRKIAIGEELSSDEDDEEPMDLKVTLEASAYGYKQQKPKPYANKLMLSEWLVDIPEEDRLSGEWLMVPCPKGRRCLLVASGGVTSAYSKSGFRVDQFQSYFPGGSRSDSGWTTILDGIIDNKKKIFYVLDLLIWKDNPMDVADYACRHFMMESRISENPLFSEKSSRFPYRFVPLPAIKCTREDMEAFMEQHNGYFLDGLLFFHSQVLYSPGQNPLVGWLKPWMLPEILKISVPEKFTKNVPELQKGGTRAFISKFNSEHKHKCLIHQDVDMAEEVSV